MSKLNGGGRGFDFSCLWNHKPTVITIEAASILSGADRISQEAAGICYETEEPPSNRRPALDLVVRSDFS
jgi:hypothetical protein